MENNEWMTVAQYCKKTGMKRASVYYRILKGEFEVKKEKVEKILTFIKVK